MWVMHSSVSMLVHIGTVSNMKINAFKGSVIVLSSLFNLA